MMSVRLQVFLALSTTILFLTTVSPFFLHESIGQWAGSWQKAMFSSLCHQNPVRSLQWHGIPAAVCGRCLGIYAFVSVGFVFMPVLERFFLKYFRYSKAILITAVIILLVDFGLQWLNIYEGTNTTRMLTGSALGFSIPVFIIYKG